jgi:signal transduction histidine kinase
MLDAAETLASFMVDGIPDWIRFQSTIGPIVAKGAARFGRVRAYGEMVNLLWEQGNLEATLALEEMWNSLAKTYSFSLLCAYLLGNFNQVAHHGPLNDVCKSHSHVIPSEEYTRLNDPQDALRMIAHLQQKARALQTEVEERRRAVQARDEFISIASHELRTPLTSMLLQIQSTLRSLPKRALSEDENFAQRRKLEQSTRRLSRLVEELLDMARISAGKFVLNREMMDLSEVVREAVDTVRPPAVHVETEPARGNWDRSRLLQVAINLLSNAAKYGEGEPIHVSVTNGSRARLTVADQGVGMTPELLSRVFLPFARGNGRQHPGGLGLGLYICRQIVESHGGSITVASTPGTGATFTVELPL